MTTRPESPMYAALYGKESRDNTEIEWLAKYVIRSGFSGDTSRFEQIVEAGSELADEATCVEVWRLRSEEVEQLRGITGRPRVVTASGLVAEITAKGDGEGNLRQIAAQPPPPRDVSPFPGVHVLVQ